MCEISKSQRTSDSFIIIKGPRRWQSRPATRRNDPKSHGPAAASRSTVTPMAQNRTQDTTGWRDCSAQGALPRRPRPGRARAGPQAEQAESESVKLEGIVTRMAWQAYK